MFGYESSSQLWHLQYCTDTPEELVEQICDVDSLLLFFSSYPFVFVLLGKIGVILLIRPVTEQQYFGSSRIPVWDLLYGRIPFENQIKPKKKIKIKMSQL